jgi:hypothetical protein
MHTKGKKRKKVKVGVKGHCIEDIKEAPPPKHKRYETEGIYIAL